MMFAATMTALPSGGMASVSSRAQFLAFVAGRLAALPAPFPDLAILSVGLPGLAAFHQTYGQPAAEHMLHQICTAISRFAPEAVLGRLADEQLVMSYEFDAEWMNIEDVASELRGVIAGSSGPRQLSLAAPPCLGAVVHRGRPPRGMSLDLATELMRQSNLALQSASHVSRDGFTLYSAAEDERVRSTTLLEQSLREALSRQEFRLHYQPIVDLRSMEMVGLEGLIRWQNPITGLRPPNDFIAAAESSGLIVPIGAAVIEAASAQVDAWLKSGWTPPRVAINVSAAQLQDPAFRAVILRAACNGKVTPACLELEMTERTLITWSSSTRRLLDELREMGITISLDDFGTGYSSLQYLRDMPISKLKIDGAFIRHIATDRRDAALVKTIVGLGDALGVDVVAEVIENQSQADALLECGCTLGQGYLFARPQPASQIPGVQAELRQRRMVAAFAGDLTRSVAALA